MRTQKKLFWTLVVGLVVSCAGSRGIEGEERQLADATKQEKSPSQAELIQELEKTLTNCKMSGRFTVLGKEDMAPAAEEYTITSAKKLPEGDLWLIKTRIKYGKTDATVPIPLEIKWAGDTPIITLTNLNIPGLGTFSSRVVIYDNKYAGTWQHDKVGGHLFGTIQRGEEKPEDKPVPKP